MHTVNIALRKGVGRYSLMREAAYAEDAAELVGPADDPDGWEMTSGSAKGTFFHHEVVEVFFRVRFSVH